MRLARRVLVVVAFAVLALHPACVCKPNGHVDPVPVAPPLPSDDVVNCICNVSATNEHCPDGVCLAHLTIPVCIPPGLPVEEAATFCEQAITNVAYHMMKVVSENWCDYKSQFAPAGGVGESMHCFAYPFEGSARATAADEGFCRTQCPRVVCDYDKNCGGDVQDTTGEVHPERCECSVITLHGCPGDPASDLPTAQFCRPPEKTVHPTP